MAGYISALYLKAMFPDSETILIESSKIPVIGVGESTTRSSGIFPTRNLVYPSPGFSPSESVITHDGSRDSFDMFVDCSGFGSLLPGKALRSDCVDYSSSPFWRAVSAI